MPYAVKITWSSGKSEEFRGEGGREAFMLSFFGGSGAVPVDVVVEDVAEEPKAAQSKAKESTPPPPEKPKAEAKRL